MANNYIKQVQNTIKNIDLISSFENGFKMIEDTTGTLNTKAIETATLVVNDSVKGIAAWQDVSSSAIKAGLQLSSKQQELVFTSLEGIKGQLNQFKSNWSTLIGSEAPKAAVVIPATKSTKKPGYNKTAIKKMKEAELVAFAKHIGIKASTEDLKKDTLVKVLSKLGL